MPHQRPDVIHTEAGPVYSLPMEEAIMVGCPWVADCAVIAVTAPVAGHVPFATVKSKPGAEEPAGLIGTLNATLTAKGLSTLSGATFPTGPTGKVLKRHLRGQRSARSMSSSAAGRWCGHGAAVSGTSRRVRSSSSVVPYVSVTSTRPPVRWKTACSV
jgi:acyl-CoA synthetase (AMP-forming)/AMP-acid ligase II